MLILLLVALNFHNLRKHLKGTFVVLISVLLEMSLRNNASLRLNVVRG